VSPSKTGVLDGCVCHVTLALLLLQAAGRAVDGDRQGRDPFLLPPRRYRQGRGALCTALTSLCLTGVPEAYMVLEALVLDEASWLVSSLHETWRAM